MHASYQFLKPYQHLKLISDGYFNPLGSKFKKVRNTNKIVLQQLQKITKFS